MLVLGIESSCDDTSVALLDCSEHGHAVLAEKTASQIAVHRRYGGVVPEVAGRCHAEAIVPLVEQVLAGQSRPEVIAVTAGPGLITSLLVGVEAARTLAYAWNIPLVAVNHLSGHIYSVEIPSNQLPNQNSHQPTIKFPALALVASGGHTELVLMRRHNNYERLGYTVDDAAGECFDKVAKLLGLPYPGGPEISRLAATGNPQAIPFPRPMLDHDNYDFSFAGLKTAALYYLRDHPWCHPERSDGSPRLQGDSSSLLAGGTRNDISINDFCASFEQAIVDVLVGKTLRAAQATQPQTVILAGGVAANPKLRQTLGEVIQSNYPNSQFLIPDLQYCMDNGAMIAVAGYYQAQEEKFTLWQNLDVDPNWKIG